MTLISPASSRSLRKYLRPNALAAMCSLLETRRKLLFLIMDRKVAGHCLKQVYVAESVVKDLLQNDGQGRPFVLVKMLGPASPR